MTRKTITAAIVLASLATAPSALAGTKTVVHVPDYTTPTTTINDPGGTYQYAGGDRLTHLTGTNMLAPIPSTSKLFGNPPPTANEQRVAAIPFIATAGDYAFNSHEPGSMTGVSGPLPWKSSRTFRLLDGFPRETWIYRYSWLKTPTPYSAGTVAVKATSGSQTLTYDIPGVLG